MNLHRKRAWLPTRTSPNAREGGFQDTDNNRDTRDLSLSPYQQQFFLGWLRAKDAVPPPSQFPNGRAGIGPLMSSTRPLDLVQDAASDCSVVTSLCAGIARSERGHDEVCRTERSASLVLTATDAHEQDIPIR
jgi:hypothetical protein